MHKIRSVHSQAYIVSRKAHTTTMQASAVIPYRGDRGCLMDVERHILRRSLQESHSLLWSLGLGRLHGSSKGRAFNMR